MSIAKWIKQEIEKNNIKNQFMLQDMYKEILYEAPSEHIEKKAREKIAKTWEKLNELCVLPLPTTIA